MASLTVFSADDGSAGRELWVTDGTSAGTSLLLDINQGMASSFAGGFAKVSGGFVVFVADNGVNGNEIWITDGTASGTSMLVDLAPGQESGAFGGLTAMGDGRALFQGTDGFLWVTDGTMGGTSQVIGVFAEQLTPLGDGRVAFQAWTPETGNELWFTDGTTAGTWMIDIRPGPASSVYVTSPSAFAALGDGRVIFGAFGPEGAGNELWVSDGTQAGTSLVKDIRLGSTGSIPVSITSISNGRAVFEASDGINGRELWVTDGTSSGTYLVKDINLGPGYSYGFPRNFVLLDNGRAVFRATDGVHGYELWVTDGTSAGTSMVKDIFPGSGYGVDYSLGASIGDGRVLFSARDASSGFELWVTDGTATGTSMVAELISGYGGGRPTDFAPSADGSVLFTAWVEDFSGSTAFGRELWVTDGTAAGTHLVADINRNSGGGLDWADLTAVGGGQALFNGFDGISGYELWVTDGTSGGTSQILDINPGGGSSSPYEFLPLAGGTALFRANDGVHGGELWITNGSAAGTSLVADLRIGADSSDPGSFAQLDATRAIFVADGDATGRELWVTDGTGAGTSLLKDIRIGSGSSDIEDQISLQSGTVLFTADDGLHGRELWVTDGTSSGTSLVADVLPGAGSGLNWPSLTALGDGRAVFNAFNGAAGYELWVSDGTASGTSLLLDISPGSNNSSPYEFLAIGGSKALFRANDGANGGELWVTDGSAAGTSMVADIQPGSGSSDPGSFARLDGSRFLFVADDGVHGRELWVTDGTSAGTSLVRDIAYGGYYAISSDAQSITALGNGRAVFSAFSSEFGRELWVTDGTGAGTFLLADIMPGGAPYGYGSDPDQFVALGDGRVIFRASDAVSGRELWVTDGTADGTFRAADVNSLPIGSSDPWGFTQVGTAVGAPVIGDPIADQTVAEDEVFSFTVPANSFTDPDGDRLSYSAKLSDGAALPGSLMIDQWTGAFSGAPPQDFFGTLTIRVSVTDPAGLSAYQDFDLIVLPVNDAPQAIEDSYVVARNGTLTVSASAGVLGNDSDVDIDDTISALLEQTTQFGRLTLNADGSFAYSPTKSFSGVDTFTYIAIDAEGSASSPTTVTITVAPQGATSTVYLTNEADVAAFTSTAEAIYALAGDDIIRGGASSDLIFGGLGQDQVFGDAGKDTLNGETDDDRLNGGAGDDLLTGGDGYDVFVFGPGSGRDVVTDFVVGEDRVELEGGITLGNLRATEAGTTATLANGGGVVFFEGVVITDWHLVT